MKRIHCAILLFFIAAISLSAKSSLKTTLYKDGDEPIREIHCVWTLDLDNNRVYKRMDGSVKDRVLKIIKPYPKYSTGDHTVYTFICDDDTGYFSVVLSLNFPEKDDNLFIIMEKQTLRGNHSISELPTVIYSTKPATVNRYDEMENAVYRMFIDEVASESGDTIKAKEIWNSNRKMR